MSKKPIFWLCLALALCLVGSGFAGLVQSNFCQVEVVDVTITTDVGNLTGYLFIPKTATKDTPAPSIVASHGYLNNREMQDLNYVELSRRGYVVFAMNAYGHGDSSVAEGDKKTNISIKTGGMVDAVEYLAGLDFVDASSIGVTGHSMGGGFASTTAKYYTSLENQALKDGVSVEEAKKLNKISAALITGNVPSGLAEVAPYHCDVGVIGGRFDEFFISMSGESGKNLDKNPLALQMLELQTGIKEAERVELGKRYVSETTGYTFTMWSPWEIHPWNHFSIVTARHTVDFFQTSLPAPNPLSAGNQIWWLKEMFNLVGLVGFCMLVVPLCKVLLGTKYFNQLKVEEAPVVELPVKMGKYVGGSIFNTLMSAILIIPLIGIGFLVMVNSFWPQDTTGGIGLWSLGCGLITLIGLRIGGTRVIKNANELGLKIGGKELLKTILLALTVSVVAFSTVFVADWLFQTDFRFWTFAIRIFDISKVWVAVKYFIFFLGFYLINSLAVSRSCFTKWKESKQIIVSICWNVGGIVLFLLLQYIPVLFTGITFFGATMTGMMSSAGALLPILTFPFVPILAIAAVVSVKLYKQTGKVYLAGIINAVIITMITVAGTSFSFPY